jgi:hypothetical protein
MRVNSHFLILQEDLSMGNIKNCVNFDLVDSQIWKKTQVDHKGRCVLPRKLRQKLGLSSGSSILWISAKHKNGKSNEFILEVGVKK